MHLPEHRLLQDQLKHYIKDLNDIPPDWQQFLAAVNQTYEQADNDQLRLERTLELTLQSQLQLIHAEKMSALEKLVAGLAHEFNNPVTFIHGNLNYVTEYMTALLQVFQQYHSAYPNPVAPVKAALADVDCAFIAADLPRLVTSMTSGAERIAKIVDALRTFSLLDEAIVKPMNIHDGLESILVVLNSRLKLPNGKRITIQKNYADLPEVTCYARHLNQVFFNLLQNAIEALSQSPKFVQGLQIDFLEVPGGLVHQDWRFLQGQLQPAIEITTRIIDDTNLEVQILDNGPGIPSSIRSCLFDPFFTTKTVGTGTGLGLSTSYQIVAKLHGGRLTYRSTTGLGTAFVMQIPFQTVNFGPRFDEIWPI